MMTLTQRGRKVVPIALFAAMLALVAVAFVVGHIVHQAMREVTRSTLKSILSANVISLEIWLAELESNAIRVAAGESVLTASKYLINRSEADFDWQYKDLLSEPAYQILIDEIEVHDCLGWAILRNDQVVVASNIDVLVGQAMPIPKFAMDSMIAMKETVVHAIASPVALSPDGPLSIPGGPVMAAMAPIKSENRTVGSLVFLYNPLDRFTELLSIARTGTSGETYAFNRDAVMISQSRFEEQLRDAKLLPGNMRIVSPLNISVRDPGRDLVISGPLLEPPDQLPLTLMADEATRGGSGENVMGYNDYRGVPVVGAWTWLPKYHFGMTTEIDIREAYAPMRLLRRSFWILLSLTGISMLISFALMNDTYRLRRIGQNGNRPTRYLGQYQIGDLLGKGGMGSVYVGTHEFLRRLVAIKVLENSEMTDQAVTRFEREVQLTASLRHPNTIDIYDFGRTEEGTFFYVMEFINGISLQDLVDQYGPQSAGRVIYLLEQICASIGEAHHHGLIHRDIKPANILISSDVGIQDHIKVLDFGLVKSVTATPTDETLTLCDAITGTPMYMSPEAVKDARSSGPLSDIYSLGAVGYTLLTGRPIFEIAGSVEICMKQIREDPVRPSQRLGQPLPEDLQNILMSCLRKDRTERPQTMEDLAFALRSCDDATTWDQAEAYRWWKMVYCKEDIT